MENCVMNDLTAAVYYEPDSTVGGYATGDDYGPIVVRSNLFQNVEFGVFSVNHPSASLDSVTVLRNEMVLAEGTGGWGFFICDACSYGAPATTTNATALNNIIRYAGWASRPGNYEGGLYYSDMHNAVFGNNVVALGTFATLRVRWCPMGQILPVEVEEDCDHPSLSPPLPVTDPPCIDVLPSGYRRAWFRNSDLSGTLLPVRFSNHNVEVLASQQQYQD